MNDYYKQFWDQITILVEDRLIALSNKNATIRLRTSIMGEEFEKEVNEMIGDKTYDQLIELEKEIHQTLDCPSDFKIDVEYWENVLKKLKVRKVRIFVLHRGLNSRPKLSLKTWDQSFLRIISKRILMRKSHPFLLL